MSATFSASELKFATKRLRSPRLDAPRPGVARDVYDYFMTRKGKVVPFGPAGAAKDLRLTPTQVRNSVEYLQNFYGLDIRWLRGKGWILAGEWFGSDYVDYVVEDL